MARTGGYVVLATYPSSSSDSIYEVRRGGDKVLYCTCRGWVMNKNNRSRSASEPAHCKHTTGYVQEHPGTSYGPGYAAEGFPNVAAVGKAWESVVGKSKRPVVVPDAPTKTAPAGADWRAKLLAEKTEAAQRGVFTPPDALNAWAKELDLD